jgi:hypothetical protein
MEAEAMIDAGDNQPVEILVLRDGHDGAVAIVLGTYRIAGPRMVNGTIIGRLRTTRSLIREALGTGLRQLKRVERSAARAAKKGGE